MNNLVFNTEAQELKTTIYAESPDNSINILQLDNDGNLKVTYGTATVTVSGSVTIANTSLTVAGTVTVGNNITIGNSTLTVNIPGNVTIGNASLTVNGTVAISNTSLTVAGTVDVGNTITIANASLTVEGTITVGNNITIGNSTLTVNIPGTVTIGNTTLTVNIPGAITIGNTSLTVNGTVNVGNSLTIANNTLTVNINGSTFSSLTIANATISSTDFLFPNTDISQFKTASFFIYNEGTNTLTVSLQISPTTTDEQYIDDANYTNVAIAGNDKKYFAISKFAHYTRLRYVLGTTTCTLSAYFNAQA